MTIILANSILMFYREYEGKFQEDSSKGEQSGENHCDEGVVVPALFGYHAWYVFHLHRVGVRLFSESEVVAQEHEG